MYKMSLITVSIIIPTYNRSKALQRCLTSLLNQTYKEFEVLVCDDGSTDDTSLVVSQFFDHLEIRYLRQENSGGPASPRNLGVANASGKYLAFLDSDDWWIPEKLEKSVNVLESGADFVYHDLYIVSPNRVMSPFIRKAKTRQVKVPIFNDLLANGNAINNSSVVVRREFIDSVNGFSEEKALIAAEDYDLWLKVSRKTNAFVRLPECLGYYTISTDSISTVNRSVTNIKRLIELYSPLISTSRKCLGGLHYQLAKAYYKRGSYDECLINTVKVILSGNYIVALKSMVLSIFCLAGMFYLMLFRSDL